MGPIQDKHIQVMVELEMRMPVLWLWWNCFFFLIFLRRNPRVLFAFVVIQVIIKLLNGQPYTTSVAGSEVATVYSNQIDPGLMRLVLLDL